MQTLKGGHKGLDIMQMILSDNRSTTSQSEITQPTQKRVMIEAIPSMYHFTIISFCINLHERGKFIKSLGVNARGDCQLGVINAITTVICIKSSYSLHIQQILDQKFRLIISQLQRYNCENELGEKWDSFQKDKDYRGIFWAIMSHGSTGTKLRARICEEVSILSHQSCCELLFLKRRNQALHKEVVGKQEEMTRVAQSNRERNCKLCMRVSSLQNDLSQAHYEIDKLRRHLSLYTGKANHT